MVYHQELFTSLYLSDYFSQPCGAPTSLPILQVISTAEVSCILRVCPTDRTARSSPRAVWLTYITDSHATEETALPVFSCGPSRRAKTGVHWDVFN